MWYAGIDWADEHHDALVINETGGQVASRLRDCRRRRHPRRRNSVGFEHRARDWATAVGDNGGTLAVMGDSRFPVSRVRSARFHGQPERSGIGEGAQLIIGSSLDQSDYISVANLPFQTDAWRGCSHRPVAGAIAPADSLHGPQGRGYIASNS